MSLIYRKRLAATVKENKKVIRNRNPIQWAEVEHYTWKVWSFAIHILLFCTVCTLHGWYIALLYFFCYTQLCWYSALDTLLCIGKSDWGFPTIILRPSPLALLPHMDCNTPDTRHPRHRPQSVGAYLVNRDMHQYLSFWKLGIHISPGEQYVMMFVRFVL